MSDISPFNEISLEKFNKSKLGNQILSENNTTDNS